MSLRVDIVGNGPPLVLLHGYTGSKENWLTQDGYFRLKESPALTRGPVCCARMKP